MDTTSIPDDQKQPIELFFSCRKLKDKDFFSKSDPKVKLFLLGGTSWELIGQTEVIQNELNPNFKTTIKCDFVFEVKQIIKIQVVDSDGGNSEELIGEVETQIGQLVGAKNQTSQLTLTNAGKKGGTVIIKVDKLASSNEFVFWQLSGAKLKNVDGWFDKSDPYYKITRLSDQNQPFTSYQSEFIKDNLNPIWKPHEISMSSINYGNHQKQFVIEVWDWEKKKNHKLIGLANVTIAEIAAGQRQIEIKTTAGKTAGKVLINEFQIITRPTFMDFIRGGEQLNFMLAVDFTGSNGHPGQPQSLHYFNPEQLNQYQQCILGISEIILNYDFDRTVPCLGFGGKPHFPNFNLNQVSHCFAMNGNPQDASVLDIQGMMDTYKNSLQNVELSGPTFFAPVLEHAMNVAKSNIQKNVYSVLLILTDGIIHDQPKVTSLLVDASSLPLSVIIVGVGSEDFAQMEELDCDKGVLVDSQGRKASRDLVQFVPFKQFGGNKEALSQRVLAELPKQLVQYKQMMGMKPMQPIQININLY